MDTRFRLFIIGLVGLLVVAVWMLPEWWAIANPGSVAGEILPGLAIEAQDEFLALPPEEQAAYWRILQGDDESEMPPRPDWALELVRARLLQEDQPAPESGQPFEVPAGAQVVATGEFSALDAVRTAEGELTIYRLPTEVRLLRLEDNFRSARAPDIRIIFTRNPDPTDPRGVGEDYLEVGVLRGNIGAQTYTVPEGVDFTRYPVLALYSAEYDEVLATATLR